MTSPCSGALLAGVALLAIAGAARAEGEYPTVHGGIDVDLRFHDVVDTDIPGNDTSDLFTEATGTLEIDWTRWLRTEFVAALEPVEDLDPDEERALEDHGLFIETARVIVDLDPVSLHAGKFTVNFGFDPHIFPGTFGEEPAEEIEVTERVGLGGSLALDGGGFGRVRLGASVFALDTTDLSGAVLTARPRRDVYDGGNGNTEDLSNWNLSLDVFGLFGSDGAGLHLAYLHQEAGLGDFADQDAVIFGVYWSGEVAPGWRLYPILQIAHSDGALGFGEATSPNAGLSETSASFDLGVSYRRFTAAAGLARIDIEDPVGGDVAIDLYKVSLGYDFGGGFGADVGYLWESEELSGVTEDTEVFGLRLTFHADAGEHRH